MRQPRCLPVHLAVAPLLAIVALLIITGLSAPTASAHASAKVSSQSSDACAHDLTIVSLQSCLHHAAAAGFIDNQGMANSLLAKLDAAQAAADRGQSSVAVTALQAFSHAVSAQRGKHIQAEQADHMLMHAQAVIGALAGS